MNDGSGGSLSEGDARDHVPDVLGAPKDYFGRTVDETIALAKHEEFGHEAELLALTVDKLLDFIRDVVADETTYRDTWLTVQREVIEEMY